MKNILCSILFLLSCICVSGWSNPVAKDDTVVMQKNQVRVINLLQNDYDPDGGQMILYGLLNYNPTVDRDMFIIENTGDSSLKITTNYYYYGSFELKYRVYSKKNSTFYFDTAILHLTIENIPKTKVEYIDINNIRASVEPDGSLFWDRVTSVFEVPKGGGVNSIFSAALWIGGYDQGNDLRIAAQTYRQGESFDFYPGPIADQYDSAFMVKYNRVWKVDRGMIANHYANWNKGGYKADENILKWPGNGNTSNGEAALLAPFADLNSNGIYEPNSGEYPCIYGDQAIYFMFNDDGTHTETNADSMRLEIHGMAYSFNSMGPLLNNSLFFRYRFINRSNDTFHDVYAGKWVDFDLGYAYDDYIGCDSAISAFYSYNGGNNDYYYGDNPPAVGLTFISDQMSHFVYYNNDWSLKGNPEDGADFYNYLSGRFKNGQKIRYGGDGFNTVWQDSPVNYMYPDMPDLPIPAWSEMSSGNTPSDRRGLGSIGPFTLHPGETKTMELAYVWTRKNGNNYIQNIYALLLDMKVLRIWIALNPPSCYTANTSLAEEQHAGKIISYYPNPVNDQLMLRKTGDAEELVRINILSMEGKILFSTQMDSRDLTIDLSGFPSGFYLLEVNSEHGIITEKIIKL